MNGVLNDLAHFSGNGTYFGKEQSLKKNKHKLSGTLTVYQRSDTKNENWFASIKLPKRIKGDRTRYKHVCLETTDLEQAKGKAQLEEQRVEIKTELGYAVHTKSFERVYREWLKTLRHTGSTTVYQHERTGENYFFEYFNERSLDGLGEVYIEDYWVWRQQINQTRADAGTLHPNAKVTVEPATLYAEKNSLNQFFKWAAKRNFIQRKFEMELPMKNKRNRRPTFTLEEMKRLIRHSRSWAKSVDPYIQQQQFYQRQLIRTAFLFACKSGLRNKELFQLRWKDISYFTDETGTKQMLIHVTKTNKTGERDCVPMIAVIPKLERWHKGTNIDGVHTPLAKFTEPDDLIFANWWGRGYVAHARRLTDMLESAGLSMNVDGEKRTFYAARHFYATSRLLYGDNVDVYSLAKNMGTSVEMIEKHYGHVTNQQNASKLTSKRKPFTRRRLFNDVIEEDNLIPFPLRKIA